MKTLLVGVFSVALMLGGLASAGPAKKAVQPKLAKPTKTVTVKLVLPAPKLLAGIGCGRTGCR